MTTSSDVRSADPAVRPDPLPVAEPTERGDDYLDLPGHTRTQRLLLRAIDRYQRAFAGRPSPCRFFPSCSEYGAEAIHVHGAGRGTWLTVRRLSRCRPLGPSGFDPVPPHPHDHEPHESEN